MTSTQHGIVLKDSVGNYYLIPQAELARCRVSAEQQTEVAELLRERGDAVSGYWVPPGWVVPPPPPPPPGGNPPDPNPDGGPDRIRPARLF